VANKGAPDLKAHVETEKHKKAVRGENSSKKKLANYFVKVAANQKMVFP
jgi:hypothetical protein